MSMSLNNIKGINHIFATTNNLYFLVYTGWQLVMLMR